MDGWIFGLLWLDKLDCIKEISTCYYGITFAAFGLSSVVNGWKVKKILKVACVASVNTTSSYGINYFTVEWGYQVDILILTILTNLRIQSVWYLWSCNLMGCQKWFVTGLPPCQSTFLLLLGLILDPGTPGTISFPKPFDAFLLGPFACTIYRVLFTVQYQWELDVTTAHILTESFHNWSCINKKVFLFASYFLLSSL